MPARKTADAHRALELLEEYHAQLKDPADKPLRTAIERIIRIFRSRLFQALLDIQDFYDATLMDDDKASRDKTQEALAMAMRWEKQSPMPGSDRQKSSTASTTSDSMTNGKGTAQDDAPPVPPPPADEDLPAPPPAQPVDQAEQAPFKIAEVQPSSPVEAEFEETVIVLSKKPGRGLGFSIAGGVDNQHRPGDNRVYCTKVLPGGVALEDGRLRAEDVIVQVNDTILDNVTHGQAVQSLKDAINTVILRVQRPRLVSGKDTPDQATAISAVSTSPAPELASPVVEVAAMPPPREPTPVSRVKVVILEKGGKGLGFSIAGGHGNQHIEGDNGIYVTKLIPGGVAQEEGSLEVNDKLLKVNDAVLDDVTHVQAVQALQRAAGTTYLTIEKPEPGQMLPAATSSPTRVSPARASSGGFPKDSRKLTLQKGDKGLGFNIVGGEGGEGIYISFILAGGVADLSGQLKRGDQIMDVNGTDLTNASHESAALVLKGSGRTVSVVVAYRPEEYGRFEQRIQELREKATQNAAGASAQTSPTKQKTTHVRALFDYDKNVDAGLGQGEGISFRHGDILHLITAGEGDWWQARRVNPETGEAEGYQGAIPSRRRVEKKERLKNKGKKFQRGGAGGGGGDDKADPPPASGAGVKRKRSFTFSKRLPFFKKQEKENKKSEGTDGDEPVLSYEDVRMEEINYKRPIVILGPLKDRINDDLIQEFPEKFGSCVPHTTRPKRDYEVDSRDYHFVESREQMERDIQNHLFIEAGQYNDNLYGTSVAAVKEVAIHEQKHCVLDVSGYAIRRLQVASLQPIAVFLKPGSSESILQQNRRIKPEQAQKTFERALKLGEEFAEYFTAIIEPGTPEDMYTNVKRVIRQHGGARIWVPARDR